MNKNKVALIITIVGVIVLILTSTILELNKIEKEKEFNYTVKQIETAVIQCINETKCRQGKITLKELYEKEYLEKLKNPNTKKPFNEKSYMVYPDLAFYIVD